MTSITGMLLLRHCKLTLCLMAVLSGCSSTPTPHTGSQAIMTNDSGKSIIFTLSPDRIGTPNTAHLDLNPEVKYFVPHNRILREDGTDNSFENSSDNTYRLSVTFDTDEAGKVLVQCDTTYSFGYQGECNITVDSEKYNGPLRHFPEQG